MKKIFSLFMISVLVLVATPNISPQPSEAEEPIIDPTISYRLTNSFLGDNRFLDTYSGAVNDPFMNNGENTSGSYWKPTPPFESAPVDSDNDGIPDPNDSCPNEFGTLSNGCPDSDGDNIQNSLDACPNEFGTLSNGCPVTPSEEITFEQKGIPQELLTIQL